MGAYEEWSFGVSVDFEPQGFGGFMFEVMAFVVTQGFMYKGGYSTSVWVWMGGWTRTMVNVEGTDG